jgi:hypothetical protein
LVEPNWETGKKHPVSPRQMVIFSNKNSDFTKKTKTNGDLTTRISDFTKTNGDLFQQKL